MASGLSSLPDEILEKILLDAAFDRASSLFDDNLEAFRGLALVCTRWKTIVQGDVFSDRSSGDCSLEVA